MMIRIRSEVHPGIRDAVSRLDLEHFRHVGIHGVFVAGPNMACRLEAARAVMEGAATEPPSGKYTEACDI